MTNFSPREIVSELDRHIVGQTDAKRAVAIALAQSLAPAPARRDDARGGQSEEHPDDRPDRRRQDRDLAPPCAPCQRAIPEGRGDEVHGGRLCRPRRRSRSSATSSTSASRWSRPRSARRCRPRPISRPRSACSTRWSAPTASPGDARSFRRKLRANELDDKEIDIEVKDTSAPTLDIPGLPQGQMGVISIGDMLGKAFGGRTKKRRTTVKASYEPSDPGGGGQSDRPGCASSRRRSARSRTTASSSSTRSTRSAPARAGSAAMSAAKACSATSCR